MIKIKYTTLILLIGLLPSCNKEESALNLEDQHVNISESVSENGFFDITLFADDTLFAGYNRLYLQVKDHASGSALDGATIRLYPLMHMEKMEHGAPVENPSKTPTPSSGLFEGAVVFLMPDNPAEYWSLGATIDSGSQLDTVNLPIPVVRSLKESRIVNLISPVNGKTYFISLINPLNPSVGMNDFELVANYREDMMHFLPATDLNISMIPEMPSMGHSSPNNVDPVHTGEGHYKGKVNFTMTGRWKVNLTVKQENQLLSDTLFFNITF